MLCKGSNFVGYICVYVICLSYHSNKTFTHLRLTKIDIVDVSRKKGKTEEQGEKREC